MSLELVTEDFYPHFLLIESQWGCILQGWSSFSQGLLGPQLQKFSDSVRCEGS